VAGKQNDLTNLQQ